MGKKTPTQETKQIAKASAPPIDINADLNSISHDQLLDLAKFFKAQNVSLKVTVKSLKINLKKFAQQEMQLGEMAEGVLDTIDQDPTSAIVIQQRPPNQPAAQAPTTKAK